MMKNPFSKEHKAAGIGSRHLRCRFVSFVLCVSILISAMPFTLNAIALTQAKEKEIADAASTICRSAGEADGASDSPADEVFRQTDAYVIPCVITDENGAQEDAALIVPVRKNSDLAATGLTGAANARLYTDRSGNIGVSSEGYTDASANVDVHATNLEVNLGNHTSNSMERTGGTLYLERETYALGTAFLYYNNEQAWDGKAPIRVTGEGHTINVQAVENDFMLENNYGEGESKIYHPNFPIKFDHINYRSQLVSQNFWARGNKMVFGEGFETVDNSIIGNPPVFRVFGGAEHQTVFTIEPKTTYPTNLVIESGYFSEVFGGGRANTAYGTNVTIRGDAEIDYVAGGGDDECQIAVYDQDPNNGDPSLKGVGVNVYVEGGSVATLYGGSRITHTSALDIFEIDKKSLNVYTPVYINISGGHVDNVYGMSDFTELTSDHQTYIRDSYIFSDATVNISAANSADYVVGDLYRNLPVNDPNQRHVLGTTRANITASNDFSRLNYFDVISISGSGVVVSSDEVIGGSMTDSTVTYPGSTFDGYVGQIAVTNGAKLVLDNRGIINNYYNRPYASDSRYQEPDYAIAANAYDDDYCLSHGFVGESSEARRSLSTVSINGTTAGITAASGSAFDDTTDVCGLLIHGTVQGSLGSASDFGRTAGYSTLEVTGTPKYSDANHYYYYIVADSSVNGGKAFKEPDGADYIVCYRYLEGGKIGWYLRERPSVAFGNKLVRAGDTASGAMVMSVTMNTFGCEWSSTEADNYVDFSFAKVTGTDGASLTNATDSISRAAMAGIKSDSSGRFDNVVTAIDATSGVEYLVSFDYLVDSSTPVDPTYYTVEADYHVVRDGGSYDDVRFADSADAARCVYDFAGSDDLHGSGGYDDSIMTTFPYGSSPAGADTALLRVYLPYGTTGALAVTEDDGHFLFTTDTSIDAQLDASTTVESDYATATEAYANSHFGVTIGGSELSGGVSKTLSSAVSEYICAVYSYQNLSVYDISQNSSGGLQMNLTVSNLTKGGEAVGTGNPTAVNNGELRIQTAGTYQITFRFTTRTQGEQVFVVKGKLGDAAVDASGRLTSDFVLSKAPYESNRGQNLSWDSANIIHSYANGVLSADLTATQAAKAVSLNFRLTASGAYGSSVMVPIGANRNNNDSVAAIAVHDETFKYWEIRRSGDSTAPVYARCYDPEFSYCIMNDCWISPVFESSSGDKTARLNPDALKNCDEDWLAWTYNSGDAEGVGTLIFPSEDLTFNGLKDYVIFVRVPKNTNSLGSNWSNVWNQTTGLSLDGYDGKTFVLTSYSQTYGDKTMYGYWEDTITLTQTEYTRNRWTDSEGNLSANGRSDYLYTDFEISFKDNAPKELNESEGRRAGLIFELCGLLGDGDSFTPGTYKYRSDLTNLKQAIVSRATSYTTGGASRRIQCNDIAASALTNMNRIELAKSYFNTPTNSRAIMKVTAYLVDGDDNVTLSNPVYICLYDTSLLDLAISGD